MFISRFADLSNVYAASYNGDLLALSALTASMSAWIALGVSRKLHQPGIDQSWLRAGWWLSGSIIFGLAIWGMQFIAILALRLPVAFSFEPALTAVSALPVIVAGAAVLGTRRIGPERMAGQMFLAGTLGGGIVLMHLISMAAMEMRADVLYDPAWFVLSLLAAFMLSWVTLRIKWRFERREQLNMLPALAPPVFMGLSLMGIHFTAMLGTYFFPNDQALPARFQAVMDPQTLAWVIAGSVLVLALVLAAAVHLSYRLQLASLVEKSAEFSRNLLDTANEGIITTDQVGNIRSFNAAAERMFGLRAANIIGQSVMVLLPEPIQRQREYFMDGDRLNLPRLVNRTLEMKATRADGNPFEAELTITPLQRSGQLELVGVVRDISRRKEAEQQLQAQKEHLEFLLAASPIIVYTRKASGSMPFTFVSPNVQELVGYLVDDICGAASFWSEKIHPDDCDRVMESRAQLRGSGTHCLEYRIRYPNGDYRWISDRRVMTRDRSGKPDLVIGNWADIHESKQAEEQLKANEQRMRISIECARLATWDWVISTGDLIWSDNMREKLGLNEEVPPNYESFISCVHPEDRQKVKTAFRRSLVMGERFDEEYRVVWPDRSVHWVHSIGGLINDQNDNPQQMVGILYDSTERKKLRVAPDAVQESA